MLAICDVGWIEAWAAALCHQVAPIRSTREVPVSIWHAPTRAQPQHPHIPAHPVSLQDMAIFAGGLVIAMVVGIIASGVLPT
jgi:hypothetical protein